MPTEKTRRNQDGANSAYLKMRSEYRAKLADFELEIDDGAYVDKTIGLLNGPMLNRAGLTVAIPGWINKPPDGIKDFVQLQIDRGAGVFVNLGDVIEFESTDFPGKFPYPITIGFNDLPEDSTFRLRYSRNTFNNGEEFSVITTLICDRRPPYNYQPPREPVIAWDYLDDTNLPAGGKLTLTIPGYADWRADDQVAIYMVDSQNIPDDPTTTRPIFAGFAPAPGITDSTVEIDADIIRAFGDGNVVLTYALRDRALNASPPALYKKVSLTFGLLPVLVGKPRVPQADPGPLNMRHVQEGVSVWVNTHTNFKSGDAIRVEWGGRTLPDHPLGGNPLPTIEIRVLPPVLMLEEYGKDTTGDKPTPVSYQVVRQGRLFGPESDTFNVNFETVLPWLPWPPIDWPNPVHPDLDAGEVQNFDKTRTNELTRDDKDEDATFHFTWYASVQNGHEIDFYWNGALVSEAHITFDDTQTGHVPGGPFEVVIPWRYIRDGGNGDPIPVHYQVNGLVPGNDLSSDKTDVKVNAIAVELPAASFPTFASQPSPIYPGCGALENDGSLKVAIPDLTGLLKAGDTIKVQFTPMKGDNLAAPEDPITAAIFTQDFTLGDPGFPVTGFEFLVQPYVTHILPLYDENAASGRRGRVKIQYTFNDGTEDIASEALTNRTAFHRANDACEIPRP